jgi:periplasmic protein TonB
MKRSLTLAVFFLIISSVAFSQSTDTAIVFSKVEVEAEFPGGTSAFGDYLKQNLRVNTPVKNKAPAGNYKVIIRFIVSKTGDISGLYAETYFGYGMEEEVIRVIKKSPKWTPATQNGTVVNAYRRQPVTFVVDEK